MRIAVALMTAVSISAFAMAQEPGAAPPFPVVNDLAEGWEFNGQPAPFDVLGITIGMPREAAMAKADESLQPTEYAKSLAEEETGIAGEYGIQVFYRFPWAYQARSEMPTGTVDSLFIHFTTGVSGERVSGLEREINWAGPDAPRMPDLIASLTEKYGAPSYGDLSKGSAFWIYYKGEKATLPEGNWAGKRTKDAPTACAFDGPVSRYYYEPEPPVPPKRDRLLDRKDCSGVLLVVIYEDRGVPGMAKQMKITMGGLQRQYENFMATDKFLEDELAKKMGADSAAPPDSKAPKL